MFNTPPSTDKNDNFRSSTPTAPQPSKYSFSYFKPTAPVFQVTPQKSSPEKTFAQPFETNHLPPKPQPATGPTVVEATVAVSSDVTSVRDTKSDSNAGSRTKTDSVDLGGVVEVRDVSLNDGVNKVAVENQIVRTEPRPTDGGGDQVAQDKGADMNKVTDDIEKVKKNLDEWTEAAKREQEDAREWTKMQEALDAIKKSVDGVECALRPMRCIDPTVRELAEQREAFRAQAACAARSIRRDGKLGKDVLQEGLRAEVGWDGVDAACPLANAKYES